MTDASSEPLLVAIDSAADVAGVALYEGSRLLAEATWRSRQNQSRELLPTLDWLLVRAQRQKADIGAVGVNRGPGSYAGLRVGISTAKALAFGLDIPLIGVPRLAADAYPLASAAVGRVVAVHAAGRAELAFAVYGLEDGDYREFIPARLGPMGDLLQLVDAGDIVCAELASLPAGLTEALGAKGARPVEAPQSRVTAIAALALRRLRAGDVDNADALVPLYLRAPAIGPQPPH